MGAANNASDVAKSSKPEPDMLGHEAVLSTPGRDMTPLDVDAITVTRSKTRTFAILAGLYGSLFFAALNQTIIATAVPTISSQLHSGSGYTWIGGAYLLANAASAPIWAKLSDIWGRKPVLLAAVGLFLFSSMVCALSISITMLIAARSFQGVAGGGIFQLVIIVISDLFSMRQRTLFFSFLEVMWALASGIGPILGGIFAQGPGWQWIFWINLPLSGATFILLLCFLNVHNPRTKMTDGLKALDWAGTLSILAVTLMVLLGLEFGGQTFPWDSPRIICLLVFGSLMSLVFIWVEKSLAKYPLMPMSIFGNKSNIACLALDFAHAFVFIAPEYYLPLYFQSCLSATPLHSGVLLLPLVLTAALTALLTGLLMHKTGRYLGIIYIGVLTLTIGTGLFLRLSASSGLAIIVISQLIAGVGAGCLFQPPMIALQAHTRQSEIATATATFGFVREIASAVAIVVGGVVFQNGMEQRGPSIAAAGASAVTLGEFAGAQAAGNTLGVRLLEDVGVRKAVEQAYAGALRDMWILFVVMAGMACVAAAFVRSTNLSREHVETKTGLRREEVVELLEVPR